MIEKVDSTNITSLQPSFDFNAEHNGIQCAKMLNAERACDRVWFSAKNVESWSGMSKTSLWRWLERLESVGRISSVSDLKQTKIPDSLGVPHEATLYNLNVLNQLAMACIDNEKLNDISSKFSDILSEVETTGSYSVHPVVPQPTQPALPQSYLEALKALVASEEAKESAQKALEAEKEQHEKDNADFCEGLAILESKKAEIGSRREAKAMSKAAVAVKQCKRLTDENESLKDAIGRGKNWITINAIKNNWIKVFGHAPSWAMLKSFSQQVGIMPVKDVLETITDRSGGKHEKYVNRYHIKAWTLYRDWEVSLLKSKVENI